MQNATFVAPIFLPEALVSIECTQCESDIALHQVVRPRYDYILCPHCGEEFVPEAYIP
jgi:Zn finger protein HypA/HybF involved in hydrogenase expression